MPYAPSDVSVVTRHMPRIEALAGKPAAYHTLDASGLRREFVTAELSPHALQTIHRARPERTCDRFSACGSHERDLECQKNT